jgi:parallel beta-helix repeat protein
MKKVGTDMGLRKNQLARTAFAVVICALALAWPAAATAGTVYVNAATGNNAWSGWCQTWDGATCGPKKTIQAGINIAVAGDTVIVADGTYTGTGSKNLDFGGKAITVQSASGNPAACTIDCQGSGRGFYFHSGETAASVVSGLTIRNGLVTSGSTAGAAGGAVYCNRASPTLANCVISGNAASSADSYSFGGGVYCNLNSSPTLVNCTISGNTASSTSTFCAYGGGLHCNSSSSPTLANCTITGNTASEGIGGGVYCCWSSSPTLTNCTISGNTSSQTLSAWGGGLYCENSSNATLIDCTISANAASGSSNYVSFAGGVCCVRSDLTLTNCVISGNRASSKNSSAYAGGVYCRSCAPRLVSCIISGNSVPRGGGGGMYCESSSPTLRNCTISANEGNGVFCLYSSSPTLTNCTFGRNTAYSGEGYDGGAVYGESSSNPTLTNCILWSDAPQEIHVSSTCTPVVTYCDVQAGYTGTGNLKLDPLFVNAAAGNYHLGPLSPCIDAGDPASAFSLEPEPDGGRINMGAYGNTPQAETKGWIYIDGYHIVRKTRIGRTVFEYDLTTTVRNASSQGVSGLVATLLAVPTNVQIIDGVVSVGDVPASTTVESTDTFTIQVDRSTLVSPLPISWQVTYLGGITQFTTLLDLGPPRSPGDVNCDGRVDFDDINPFVLALTGADGYYSEYPECDWLNGDCNEDGSVDFDDINAFVALLAQ